MPPGEIGLDEPATERGERRLWNAGPRDSSADENVGDERAGEARSSASETGPLSRDAAKLLDISGSETKAYEELDAVDADDMVRSRADRRRPPRGSSSHVEEEVSTLEYRRPWSSFQFRFIVLWREEGRTLTIGDWP